MRWPFTFRILGLLLMLFSLTLLPPMALSLLYADGELYSSTGAFALIALAGLILWLPVRHYHRDLRTRDGFLITVLFWLTLGLAGCLPIYLSSLGLSFTDAFFEGFSGLTTTGATVLTQLDQLPKSILFYRHQLQWLGGMGIIVLAVAILPMLGIGGMQLYRAETPGPLKDSKLTPRITETAKALWYIYLTLTIICAAAYWLARMSLFDAIAHSFSTVSIGGFSTHDTSLAYFDSPIIEGLAIAFMLLSAANFALHFSAWRGRKVHHYLWDNEYRTFILITLSLVCFTSAVLLITQTYSWADALRHGIFESVSMLTTTGFSSASFASWPLFVPFLLIMASFIGGCAGSTAGGMKVIRIMLLWKQGNRELKRLIHPAGVFPIKIGSTPVSDRVVEAVWGFFAVYTMAYAVIFFSLLTTGMDFITAWSAVAATLNNLGPGLGAVEFHYANIPLAAKWVLCIAMLLGRLEVFTLLVILNPMFWRH